MCCSHSEVRCTPSIVIHTFGKEHLSLREGSQLVRYGDEVRSCLIRSHPGPECLQKPESTSIACASIRRRMLCRATPGQDKPPHALPLCVTRCTGVMQD